MPICSFNGSLTHDFQSHESVSPRPLSIISGPSRIFLKIFRYSWMNVHERCQQFWGIHFFHILSSAPYTYRLNFCLFFIFRCRQADIGSTVLSLVSTMQLAETFTSINDTSDNYSPVLLSLAIHGNNCSPMFFFSVRTCTSCPWWSSSGRRGWGTTSPGSGTVSTPKSHNSHINIIIIFYSVPFCFMTMNVCLILSIW